MFLKDYGILFLQIPLKSVTSIIDGLKKSYIEKLRPLEKTYQFHDFVSTLLVIITPLFSLQFYLFYSKGRTETIDLQILVKSFCKLSIVHFNNFGRSVVLQK